MSAILLGIYDDYATAERVRTELFQEGFPTDRYELTACCEPGRAALLPAGSQHDQFVKYFHSLLPLPEEDHLAEEFTARLNSGCACVTVHPRGPVETLRAQAILEHGHPTALAQHDLSNQSFEYAATSNSKTWVSHFWVENSSHAHCIYCRLFEKDLPDEDGLGKV